MIVTIENFQEYTGVHPESDTLQIIYLQSAENIVADYLGYDDLTEFQPTVPGIVKLTIFRIAALLQSEENSNIGITSKSQADGSRTFVKTTDYTPYLKEISRYRHV